jgi:hypothetical protein
MFLGALVGVARADDYLKCTQQTLNPVKVRLMSAGLGTVIVKKSGDSYKISDENEAVIELLKKRQASK